MRKRRIGQRFRRKQTWNNAMQAWEIEKESGPVKAPLWKKERVKLDPEQNRVSLSERFEEAHAEQMWAPGYEHGAWTPYVIDPMAASILAWVKQRIDEPGSPIEFLRESQFEPLLDRWARAEARRMRFEGYIQQFGELDERGNAHRLMDQLVQWEKRSAYHAERLGLDPLALAKIRRELAELHKEEDAVHALTELQQRYASARRRPEVLDGRAEGGEGTG